MVIYALAAHQYVCQPQGGEYYGFFGQLAVDVQQSVYASHIYIAFRGQQSGLFQVFVLYHSVRLAEKDEFLFFNQVGEQFSFRAYPYPSLPVAYQ